MRAHRKERAPWGQCELPSLLHPSRSHTLQKRWHSSRKKELEEQSLAVGSELGESTRHGWGKPPELQELSREILLIAIRVLLHQIYNILHTLAPAVFPRCWLP